MKMNIGDGAGESRSLWRKTSVGNTRKGSQFKEPNKKLENNLPFPGPSEHLNSQLGPGTPANQPEKSMYVRVFSRSQALGM